TEAVADMAERGLRVLAVAVGESEDESRLKMLGLVGMADPPRTEAIDAVAKARRAGIKTVMITGDHPITARAIARELGILTPSDDPDEVVHARATPDDKIRIVRGWKERGAIVAMTGDGVNDAPALKEAHIGIAMGRTGTEVAREASAMVLTDDNFASIIGAVQEGRGIFENIRKTLVYLLSGNAGELTLVFVASLAGLPLPLTALQILWINLVTDGLPALALVMDPSDPDALAKPPRSAGEPILGRREWRLVLATGALQGVVSLSVFLFALREGDLLNARNLAFSTLVFGELFRSFAARSSTRTFWEMGPFTNVRLVAVVAITALLQIGIHHVPFAQELFDIGDISLRDCILSVSLGLVPVTILELSKLVRRALASRSKPGLPSPIGEARR
ncbi:MAG: HAD-IC family P-type ATPase, partial [Polyangiaceae bacterium]|nr:HAD-IC family P-type ATPase [Polyangiaceae bacterium]